MHASEQYMVVAQGKSITCLDQIYQNARNA